MQIATHWGIGLGGGLPIGRVFSNFGGGFGGLLWNANSSRQRFRSFCI